jgi:aminoglycoside 3'-phosphotransferase-1
MGSPMCQSCFLKHGKGKGIMMLQDEMVRLNWLMEFIALPPSSILSGTLMMAWLLTTAIPGKTAFQVLEEYPDSGENIVDALAVFLRRLRYLIPVCNCPLTDDRVFRPAQQSRMNNGLAGA